MTFQEILTTIVDGTPGALAGAIMATDGIPVEEYERGDAEVELSLLAVEFQRVLEQSNKVAAALYRDQAEPLREMILVTAGHQLLFRPIDSDFFIVLVLEPGGSLGKARYLIRTVLHNLKDAL